MAKEETTWRYVHDRPDLIEEIITNRQEAFDNYTRTIRLIELVEFCAQVDAAPTNHETDRRAIQLEYGGRAKSALVKLVESSSGSLCILTSFLKEHCMEHAVVEVEALLSLFAYIDLGKALPETAARFIELSRTLFEKEYAYLNDIKTLVQFWNSGHSQDDIERYLLEILDGRECRPTLRVLVDMKTPSTGLVRKVRQLSTSSILRPAHPEAQVAAKHLLEVWRR